MITRGKLTTISTNHATTNVAGDLVNLELFAIGKNKSPYDLKAHEFSEVYQIKSECIKTLMNDHDFKQKMYRYVATNLI